LVIIGSNIVQAQGKSKKPPKPSENYTWEVKVEEYSNNLYAVGREDGIYRDSEQFVNVSYYVQTYINVKFKETWYTPIFRIDILPGAQIGFQGVGDPVVGNPPVDEGGEILDYSGGGFPPEGRLSLFEFLNQPHPQLGYEKVMIVLKGYSYQDKDQADFTKMTIGESKKMILTMWIVGQNYDADCSECIPEDFNNIMADAFGFYDSGLYTPWPADLYVIKEDEDNWRVVVNTEFNNPTYTPADYYTVFGYKVGRIYQEYYECVPVQVKKRTVMQRQTVRPYWARARMAFEMLFTRHLQ
jgi:hypothetical protein